MIARLLALFVIFPTTSFAAGLGSFSQGFERIPLSATAWGRGNAITANPEYGAAQINPSQLAFTSGFGLALGNTVRGLGRVESFLAADYRIPNTRIGVGGVFAYRGITNLDDLRLDGQVFNSTSFINTSLRLGMGAVITANWSVGFSATWFYSRIPVGFSANPDSRNIETNTSSTVGGFTLMATRRGRDGLTVAFGIRDMFSYSDWSFRERGSEMINNVMDTMPMLFVVAAEYEFRIRDEHQIRVSTDFNGYIINSFFRRYESAALAMNYGVEWAPNDIIIFRTGVRDILVNRNLFRNSQNWRVENNPRFGFGVGVNLEEVTNWALSRLFRVNYAVANSGAQAGLEHSIDLVWRW